MKTHPLRFIDIPFFHLRRRKGHALFLILGLTVGVAAVVAVVSLTTAMQAQVDRKLNQFGANVLVMPRSLDLAMDYGGVSVATVSTEVQEMTEGDAMQIATIKRKDALRVISPKLVAAMDVDGKKILVQGVYFRQEMKLKPWWQFEGDISEGSREVILGQSVEKELDKKIGDPILLNGKEFRVAALLDQQLSQDDTSIFADLREVGALLGKPGHISMVELSAWCTLCPVDTIAQQIEEKLPNARVWAVKQAWEAQLGTLNIFSTFSLSLAALILLISSLILGVTMMSSVNERTREIGVFRAIGFRQGHIMVLILLEGTVISFLSGLLGNLVGYGLAIALAQPVGGVETVVVFDPMLAAQAIGLALVVGLCASFFPARQATRLDPVVALRAI